MCLTYTRISLGGLATLGCSTTMCVRRPAGTRWIPQCGHLALGYVGRRSTGEHTERTATGEHPYRACLGWDERTQAVCAFKVSRGTLRAGVNRQSVQKCECPQDEVEWLYACVKWVYACAVG